MLINLLQEPSEDEDSSESGSSEETETEIASSKFTIFDQQPDMLHSVLNTYLCIILSVILQYLARYWTQRSSFQDIS